MLYHVKKLVHDYDQCLQVTLLTLTAASILMFSLSFTVFASAIRTTGATTTRCSTTTDVIFNMTALKDYICFNLRADVIFLTGTSHFEFEI